MKKFFILALLVMITLFGHKYGYLDSLDPYISQAKVKIMAVNEKIIVFRDNFNHREEQTEYGMGQLIKRAQWAANATNTSQDLSSIQKAEVVIEN